MSASQTARQFEERGALLPGNSELAALRRSALARFEAEGLPGRRIESWRYTELAPLSSKALDYVAAAPAAEVLARAAAAVAGLELDAGATRLVFVDGYCIEELSSRRSEPGLDLRPLGELPRELVAGNAAGEPALAALNQAFVRDGAEIQARGALTRPLAIVVIGSGRGIAAQLRFRLTLAPAARLVVVLHRLELGGAAEAWFNTVTDAELADDSRLELSRLQQHGDSLYSTDLTRVRVGAGATFVAGSLEAGGQLVRHELDIRLEGAGAAAEVGGLALTGGRQHCDTRVAVDHRAPRTTSRQSYRSIATGASRSVFNGKVTVRKDAQHIDARQENHSLLLSAQAEVDSKPELEIHADQVACSHGATVGELDDEALFYLRSRGIDEGPARAILTEAFAAAIIDGFAHEDFRERARAAVAGWLATHAGSRD